MEKILGNYCGGFPLPSVGYDDEPTCERRQRELRNRFNDDADIYKTSMPLSGFKSDTSVM